MTGWSLSYRKQSIPLLCKSMDWFLFDRALPREIVKISIFNNNYLAKEMVLQKNTS